MSLVRTRRNASRVRLVHLGAHALLMVLSILILAPYLWAVGESFKPLAEASAQVLVPHTWTLDNYISVLTNPESGLFF